jgi:hypothetical protein
LLLELGNFKIVETFDLLLAELDFLVKKTRIGVKLLCTLEVFAQKTQF